MTPDQIEQVVKVATKTKAAQDWLRAQYQSAMAAAPEDQPAWMGERDVHKRARMRASWERERLSVYAEKATAAADKAMLDRIAKAGWTQDQLSMAAARPSEMIHGVDSDVALWLYNRAADATLRRKLEGDRLIDAERKRVLAAAMPQPEPDQTAEIAHLKEQVAVLQAKLGQTEAA